MNKKSRCPEKRRIPGRIKKAENPYVIRIFRVGAPAGIRIPDTLIKSNLFGEVFMKNNHLHKRNEDFCRRVCLFNSLPPKEQKAASAAGLLAFPDDVVLHNYISPRAPFQKKRNEPVAVRRRHKKQGLFPQDDRG